MYKMSDLGELCHYDLCAQQTFTPFSSSDCCGNVYCQLHQGSDQHECRMAPSSQTLTKVTEKRCGCSVKGCRAKTSKIFRDCLKRLGCDKYQAKLSEKTAELLKVSQQIEQKQRIKELEKEYRVVCELLKDEKCKVCEKEEKIKAFWLDLTLKTELLYQQKTETEDVKKQLKQSQTTVQSAQSFNENLLQQVKEFSSILQQKEADSSNNTVPIPSNYFCAACSLEADHWIMDCTELCNFHKSRQHLANVANNQALKPLIKKQIHA